MVGSTKSRVLIAFAVAICAIIASQHLKHIISGSASISSFIFSSSIFSKLLEIRYINSHFRRHHHPQHHHHRHEEKVMLSICDDFPADFPPPGTNTTSYICVDQNGCCNFTTVQAAVDAVQVPSLKRTIVWINSGLYYEKVVVPKSKTNITFQGQGYLSTAIVWNDTANSSHGTFYSGSVQVFAANFIAKNISFMNVAPIPKPGDVGAQAVAIRVAGDQSAFWGCGFFGAQDTLHDDRGRHYYKDCYIQGSIDFIFGNAKSLYENCQITSIASQVPPGVRSINGVVTAQGRSSMDENSGYSFVNCSIGGTGRIWLGRAWRPFSKVVYAYTSMSDIIAPEGWNDFGDPSKDQSVFYGEYMCSGAGSNTSQRVPYEQRLNDTQALYFLNVSFIDADQWLQPFNL
ncbi:probable pectinesterase 8 [Impatiens glandulifera]|uniref:probable pectinesterase 8 n=1 Tax=Impatiens glandulifera TaxID=253017 RepID=UPI001FB19993|nr:probable pectinesterase 8 [Impatiens glandulifera]